MVLADKYDPRAADHGRPIRMANLAAALRACGADVECLFFSKNPAQPGLAALPAHRTVLGQAVVGAWRMHRRLRSLERERGRKALVQVSNPHLILFLWLARRGRATVYEAHVVERDFWAKSNGVTGKLRLLAPFHRLAERLAARIAGKVVALGPEDRDRLARLFPRAVVEVVPHTLDARWFAAPRPRPREGPALFVGSFGHAPNRQALSFLAGLAAEVPGGVLAVGRGIPPSLAADGLEVRPDAQDVLAAVDAAPLCLAPFWERSGVRTKVLEYLARARPVVATADAMSGTGARPGEHFVQAEDGPAFVQAVRWVHDNPAAADRIGKAGRELVLGQHTPAALEEAVRAVYLS